MTGRKIVGMILFLFIVLNIFLFFQEEAEAAGADYIVITDTPNGTELVTVVLPVGGKVTAYASAYNSSGGYVGLVNVSWYEFIGLGTLDNSSGTSTTFTAGMSGGLTTILGMYNSTINDTFDVSILDPTVDYIDVTDTPGGAPLLGGIVPPNYEEWGNCSAYNYTSGYLYTVSADWYVGGDDPTLLGPTPAHGNGINVGTVLWYKFLNVSFGGHTDSVTYLVSSATVDYIQIRSASGGGGVDLGDPANYPVYPSGYITTFYGAAYNNTVGYIGPVNASATWISSDLKIVSVTSPGSSSTINCSSTNWGTVTITLDDGWGHVNTTKVTVLAPPLGVDYILIRDADGGRGNEVTNATYWVYDTDVFYAAAYNYTAGYLWDVEVDWISDEPSVGKVSTPGKWTNFTAQEVTVDGISTVTATYQGKLNDSTGLLTVLAPMVDYILLTDWAHQNGSEIPDMDWNVGVPLPIFASGYNNSHIGPLYVGPVEVNWTDTPDFGDFDNLTGTSTIFTGSSAGTTNIKGENVTLNVSDDFNLTLLGPSGTVDYLLITDAPNGTVLTTVILPVGGKVTCYASGYNFTNGYVGLVVVNWSDIPDLGSFDTLTGTSTTFTAGFVGGSSTITGQNNSLGVSDIFTVNILTPTLDFIILTAAPNGSELPTIVLYSGEKVIAYASGYNATSGYLGLVEVNWSESAGLGSLDNLTGTSTMFTAGASSGLTTITGQNDTLGMGDTFDVSINPPTLDYIEITDTPNGTPLTTVNLEVYGSVTACASGYNNSVGYIGLIEVNWSESAGLGSLDNVLGMSTTFTAGVIGGWTTITGENSSKGVIDSFDVFILPPEVDYIILTDTANGITLTFVTLNVGESITVYASAYNNTCGYIGLIWVNWDEPAGLGNMDNSSGTSTTFTAGFSGGTTTITGTNSSEGVSDSFDVHINPPQLDYILIRTQPGGGGINLCDPLNFKSYSVGDADTYYGAMYNYTTNYFDDVPGNATWSSSNNLIVKVTSPGYYTDINCDDHNWGTVTITLSTSGRQNTTQVTVIKPTVDYIHIRDEAGGLGNIVTTKTYVVWEVDNFYAAAYNHTANYLEDVEVIWESDDTNSGKVTSFGLWTNFTAQKVAYDSVCHVNADYHGISDSTDDLTVLAPRIDYISIVDAPNGSGVWIGDITYNEGDKDVFWAAGYNDTADYVKDVEAIWASNNTTVGKVTSGPDDYTNFTAGWKGGYCKVSATFGTLTNQTGIIYVINVNTLPTAEGKYYNGTGFSGGNFTFSTDITLRVTGRKENIVTMKLEEDGTIVKEVEVTRHSGNPDTGEISHEMNVQKVYRIVLTYNGHNGGSNPIIVTFEFLERIYSVHLLFNSQDGEDQEAILRFNDVIPMVGVVFFDASLSSDFEGYLVDYQWNFGDGDTGSGETLAHAYDENDEYTVTLTVTDDEGGTDSSTIIVPVENIDDNNQANAIPRQKGAKGFLNDSGECIVILQCPADLRIINITGLEMGLVNGSLIRSIEGAFIAMKYSDIEVYYIPFDKSYIFEVTGIGEGIYDLNVIRVNDDRIKIYGVVNVTCTENTVDVYVFDFYEEEISISTNEGNKLYSLEFSTSTDGLWDRFNLIDMKLSKGATHTYIINNWEALSLGKPVTLLIDEDNDGTIDMKIDLETGLSGDDVDTLILKEPVSEPFPILLLIIASSVFAIGVGGLLTEAGKWALISMMLPLYTRLKKEELLDQPTRYKIYGYILGNPGAYFLLMRQVLELGSGQLVYHLKQLEDAKLIYSRVDGSKKRFYPANIPQPKDGSIHFSDIEEKMLGIIKDNSGIVQKKIASKMGISRQVAGYHLTNMTRMGIINKEIEGRKTRYYLVKESIA